jgi:hypothetical protein
VVREATLLILSANLVLGPPTRATGQVTSGEWLVHWSPAGAFAIHETEPRCVPIFTNSHETRPTGNADQLPEGGYFRSTHRILSTVGNVVSFTEIYDGSGGAHPIAGERYATLDLATREPADIAQLFDEAKVVTALARHPVIVKHLRGAKPKGLDEMVAALGSPCEMYFHPLRSAFRVKKVRGARAVIEFGLGHGCEVMRGNFTAIEIELPIPPDRGDSFLEAMRSLPRFPEEEPDVEPEVVEEDGLGISP